MEQRNRRIRKNRRQAPAFCRGRGRGHFCARRVLGTLLVLCLLLLPAGLTVSADTAQTPVPEKPESFAVYDSANVISQSAEQQITERVAELEEKYGIQITVMTQYSLSGVGTSEFTKRVFSAWQLGGEKENGLILLLNLEGDTYYAYSGAGLGKEFNHQTLQTLLDEKLEPDFAKQNYEAGAMSFFVAAADRAEAYAAANPELFVKEEPEEGHSSGIVVFFQAVGIFLLVLVLLVLALVAVIYVRGQIVRAQRQSRRRTRRGPTAPRGQARETSREEYPQEQDPDYPPEQEEPQPSEFDDLSSSSQERTEEDDKYGFDMFKPRY